MSNDKDSELVWGAVRIGKEIGKPPRSTFYLLESGRLPAFKAGDQWVAKRADLRDPSRWPNRNPKEAA